MLPHLRIARPTDNLAAVEAFYREGLGFDRICGFLNHDGFDGVMLGLPDASYHLEFTHAHGHTVGRAPSSDNLLVLYLPNRAQWDAAVMRLRQHGHHPVPSCNPYWDRQGLTFEDPDGYRVVLQHAAWDPPASRGLC